MTLRMPVHPELLNGYPYDKGARERYKRAPRSEQRRMDAEAAFRRKVAYGELAATPLRLARLRAGLLMAELAERAYLGEATLSAYETGRKRPAMRSAVHVVNALRAAGQCVEVADLWPELSEEDAR